MEIRHLRWADYLYGSKGFTVNGELRAILQPRSQRDPRVWCLYDVKNNKLTEHASIDILKVRAEHYFELGMLKLPVEQERCYCYCN